VFSFTVPAARRFPSGFLQRTYCAVRRRVEDSPRQCFLHSAEGTPD